MIRLNRNLKGFERRLPEISCFGPMSNGDSPACTDKPTFNVFLLMAMLYTLQRTILGCSYFRDICCAVKKKQMPCRIPDLLI